MSKRLIYVINNRKGITIINAAQSKNTVLTHFYQGNAIRLPLSFALRRLPTLRAEALYIASIPSFVALYQTFKVLGNASQYGDAILNMRGVDQSLDEAGGQQTKTNEEA